MDMTDPTGPCSDTVVTDESYLTHAIKLVPATRATDDSHTTEYDCRDCFDDVKPGNLQDIKEEPKDVCYMLFV